MTKEDYKKRIKEIQNRQPKIKFGSKPTEEQKEIISQMNEDMKAAVQEYIESNKPCSKNDFCVITLHSGRTVKGVVLSIGILHDGNIHPTSYKQGSKVKFISQATQEVRVIKQ